MDAAKVVVYAPVMGGETGVSIPDGSVLKMACAFLQGRAVRSLIYLDGQADGGDLQRTQMAAAVIEVAGDIGKGCAVPGGPTAIHGGVLDTSAGGDGAHQAAAQSAGDKVWRQRRTAAGQVAGGAAERGRDERGVLAPVHIDLLGFVNGILRGRPPEKIVLRGLDGIFQRTSLSHAQGAHHSRKQKQADLLHGHRHLLSFSFFTPNTPPTAMASTTAPMTSGVVSMGSAVVAVSVTSPAESPSGAGILPKMAV